ncbi:MAG: 3-oxoacyl-ACP reductase FabG [Acidobacteria bacterium]|nr:3-oxoacyl-ACP reductase FabG [Acidobacteriota bacterium]
MTMTPFDLSGKVAVVTGGNRGIGLGIVRGLAEAGARVVVAARNRDKSRQVVQQIQEEGGEALAVNLDVGDESSVDALMQSTVEHFGCLDILVNNAGINIRKTPEKLTLPEWSKVLQVNLTGIFLCSQAAYPAMKSAGRGKIINIGSMLSIFGASFSPAYGASKGGVVQLTKSLASAWAADGIQVNAILPGFIDTDLTRQGRRDVPTLHEHVLKRTPAGRWGTLKDCAGTAVFLASAASDFVTGAAIPVDGGFSMQV